jgi:hypothetical protein
LDATAVHREGLQRGGELLLEKDVELESKDFEYGRMPLSWAAEKEHETVVKLVVKNGVNMPIKTFKQFTLCSSFETISLILCNSEKVLAPLQQKLENRIFDSISSSPLSFTSLHKITTSWPTSPNI